jgi:hypothetical protein
MKSIEISMVPEGDGYFAITMSGAKLGRPVTEKEAFFLVGWLRTAVLEVITNAEEAERE